MVTLLNTTEIDLHVFAADASDLGLPVGEFPVRLDTTLGNRLPFILSHRSDVAGTYIYRQEAGNLTLKVFND